MGGEYSGLAYRYRAVVIINWGAIVNSLPHLAYVKWLMRVVLVSILNTLRLNVLILSFFVTVFLSP